MSLAEVRKTIMTEQRNMQMNAEKENESELIEQRILKMRAEIVEIEKEIVEIRKESERRSAKIKAETEAIRKETEAIRKESEAIRKESDRRSAEMKAESDAIRKEADAKWEKNNQTLAELNQSFAELNETNRQYGKQIGGYGNQIGDFTESLAMPSIRRILDQRFNADFQGDVNYDWKDQDGPLQVDAWGISRNGAKEVYLVEIKRKFKRGHIHQVRQMVKRFRSYYANYSDSPIYPVITAVKISDIDRRKLWEMGMYVIDIADGVFNLATPPAEIGFEPKGGYGMPKGVQRAVPPLNLVWDRESQQRKVR